MVSQRYRSQQTIGGKLLRLEQKADQAASSNSSPPEDGVNAKSLSTNSVTADALAPNAVDSEALGPGAVGTENLGVVDQINAGNKLALNTPGGVQLVGPAYTTPVAGSYLPLAIDSSGTVVAGTGATYKGVIDPLWTTGRPNVTLSDGTVVAANVGNVLDFNPGDPVVLMAVGGVFTIIAQDYVKPTFPKLYDLTSSLLNGWSNYYSAAVMMPEYGPAAVTMDSYGNVYMSGLIRRVAGNPTSGSLILMLPQKFWPTERRIFTSYTASGIGQVEVDINGAVTWTTGGAGFVGLDNIRYTTKPASAHTVPTLANTWVNFNGTYAQAGYLKDPNGVVWTKGLVRGGSGAAAAAIFDYDSSINALLTEHFVTVSANAFGYYRIGGVGGSLGGREMNFGGGTPGTWFSLESSWVDQNSPLQWTAPLLANGWADYNPGGFATAGFTKTPDGIVHLKGLIKSGTSTMFILPVGYRPAFIKLIAVTSNAAIGRLDIRPDGSVLINVGSNTWFSLDGISFAAGA